MTGWTALAGGLLLIAVAAYVTTAIVRRRRRRGDLAVESAAARRNIRLAEAARDAAAAERADADRLLTRAQALMSDAPNAATAVRAGDLARRAQKLWNTPSTRRGTSRTSSHEAPDGTSPAALDSSSARRGIRERTASRYAAAIAAEPKIDGTDVVKIGCVVLLGLIGLIFISQQTQRADVTFTGQDSRSLTLNASEPEPIPTYEQIVAEYGDAPIVTLPGATAVVDPDLVSTWMAQAEARQIVLAPPIAAEAEDSLEVPDDVVRVIGTDVSFGSMTATPDDFAGMQQRFAAADVTSPVIALLAHSIEADDPQSAPEVSWRAPTPAEMAPVVSALESDGIAFVGDTDSFTMPSQAARAYPEGLEPLVVVAPYAEPGQPAVNYADAVATQFPDRPVVAMTGLWIDFAGSYAADFEAPLIASFYGQFGQRLQEHAYSQEAVLQVALGRVEQFRHSGIFDQPLPYRAPDPLELTLPALPWICAALGLTAVVAAVVQLRRQQIATPAPVTAAALHRLAGLSELAVEVSGLTEGRSKAALLRALRALTEAKDAAEDGIEDAEVVDGLLQDAERELSAVADRIGRPEYRPAAYLPGRWS